MVHRELTASDLVSAALRDLIRDEDPLGVVSIYVDMPADGADRRAEIVLKNQLADLERRVDSEGSLRRGEALRSAIERVMPTIERLLDPAASGRGGAAFSPLSTSEVTFLTAPMPLPSRVVLDSRPFIQPLVEPRRRSPRRGGAGVRACGGAARLAVRRPAFAVAGHTRVRGRRGRSSRPARHELRRHSTGNSGA